MRQALATVRHRPAPLVGTFVALVMAAIVVTWSFSMGLARSTSAAPAARLAGAGVVVTAGPYVTVRSGSRARASADVVALTSYRRLPAAVAPLLRSVPGVQEAVADRSVPLALVLPGGGVAAGTTAHPLTGFGWPSARLTPFHLVAGTAPRGPGQLVLGQGVAAQAHVRVGTRVRLTGEAAPTQTVVGIAAAPAGNPAGNWSAA